ncbi:phosphoribosylanthranilate isomerase [Algoriphagus kandeliae]|uniref:phosphoribosylanthranilate isomerase n=1 Tax=Algoriphagus kandeliae TaxID=2562278 RepID=A0A4Y9QZH0_9BACT|nr:phosphoribosylanthranilate isomerase [Algoriphagus kandeliae]TFV97859.1 phosphoribosylanthranilate isomerase [Algoriphagus kandeliae]
MALSTFVKISGVTNLSDARYSSGMYVDVIGFCLDEASEKFVPPTLFSEITGWVSGCDFCAEFKDDDSHVVSQKLSKYQNISWIQHNHLDVLLEFADQGYQLIFEAPLQEIRHIEDEVAEKIKTKGIHLLLTTDSATLDGDQLKSVALIAKKAKVILAGGISPFNVKSLINDLNLFGIALEGGEEIKPGLKDYDELAEILEELEIED